MTDVRLNLCVIRSRNIERLAGFYTEIGLTFVKHRHGVGEEHFAFENDGMVFEIYPQADDSDSTVGVRLGFSIASVTDALEKVVAAGGTIVSNPKRSEWGLRAVVADPEGRRVELIEPIAVDEQ